jgi:hypothetical protein
MTSEKHNNKLCKSYFCRSSYRNGRVFGHGQRENLNTMPSRVSMKKAPPNICFSEELRGTKEELLQVAQKFELEGLVCKAARFSLREWPAQRRLGQSQTDPTTGVCHRPATPHPKAAANT